MEGEERDPITWPKKAAPPSLAGQEEEKHSKPRLLVSLPPSPPQTSEMKSTQRGKCAIIKGGGARLMPLSLLSVATFFFSPDIYLFTFSIFPSRRRHLET